MEIPIQELALADSMMRLFVRTVAFACVMGFRTPTVEAAPAPTACDLLSAAEIQQIFGKPGQVQDARPNSCLWFAPVNRKLTISIDPAIISEPNEQHAMLRSLAHR